MVRSTPPRSSTGAAQRFGRAGKGVAKGGLWRDAFGFGGFGLWCYWGKRRKRSDGWAGGGSPQKPYPLPAVCLGRRLTVIDVRPALAVTEAKDGHGRKFLSCVYCRNRSRLGRFRPRETGTTGNRVAPKKYRSILFRSARGRWGSNPAGIPIRGGSIHDIERSPLLKIVGHDFERTILSEDPPRPASDDDANFHSQARSNRLRLAETNRVPATLVHSPRHAIHGRVSGLLGFYKLLKI